MPWRAVVPPFGAEGDIVYVDDGADTRSGGVVGRLPATARPALPPAGDPPAKPSLWSVLK
jgi:hypothetical protein